MSNERIDLLLAFGDEGEAVLEDGLPQNSADRGPKPKKAVRGDDAPDWRRTDADPNDLRMQHWGLVVPEGKEGDVLLEAMAPLIRLREEEQGAPVMTYRVPPEMDAKAAVAWKDEVYWSEDIDEEDRPLYLMLLGDVDRVSLELQHSLGNCAIVGRGHFANDQGDVDAHAYAAYAEKVVRYARYGTPSEKPAMLFHVAKDGTKATLTGESMLVTPCIEAATKNRASGRLPVADVREIDAEGTDAFMAAGAQATPSVLLSVSHGVGAPRRGWNTEEEARRKQGALVLGQNDILDAERLGTQPFLPGGLWFMLACFGAGTPAASAYHAWLSLLAQEGAYGGKTNAVLASLPSAGQRPFVAALPQAALANPQGPLAIVGHMDLAWTYGFSNATNLSESRKSRFFSALEVWARGSRAGVGIEALMRFYRETNDALMASYQSDADARTQGRAESADRKERGHLWMLRNDLRGYVLLGDPAVRLPLAQHALGGPAKRDAPVSGVVTPLVSSSAGGLSIDVKEAAVLALIRGEEAPAGISRRAGTTVDELFAWFDAYRAGGRTRL
jgi:hypothetical protein